MVLSNFVCIAQEVPMIIVTIVTSTITDEVNGSTTEDRNKPRNEIMIDMTMTPITTVVTIQILFLVAGVV